MIGRHFNLLQAQWFKKEVSLSWEGSHLSLAVAQELFSSHVVDAGSLLLLRSIDPGLLAATGTCIDFGCGYGVLGLAFKLAKPNWDVTLIDRDALAVEFSEWNADRLELDVTCIGGIDVSGVEGPLDYVLWNVPGKAGSEVLQRLTALILDRLAPGGMLALVIVHPLAREVEEIATSRSDIATVHESAGPEHTVFHLMRTSGEPADDAVDAFAVGTFDREEVEVDTGLLSYRFRPVIGLPQYDGPDISTVLLTDGIEALTRANVASALCISPGQGHVPIYLRQRWPDIEITLIDRDLLALRSSSRSIGEVQSVFAAADIGIDDRWFDLVTAALPNQIRPPVMQHLLQRLLDVTVAGSHVAVAGGSTEVSRFISLARKHPELRLRNRDKRKGYSATVFERR